MINPIADYFIYFIWLDGICDQFKSIFTMNHGKFDFAYDLAEQ